MAYRNIEVDGKTYKYVVGKSHTKVVGVGVGVNLFIGNVLDSSMEIVEVAPRHVRRFIEKTLAKA